MVFCSLKYICCFVILREIKNVLGNVLDVGNKKVNLSRKTCWMLEIKKSTYQIISFFTYNRFYITHLKYCNYLMFFLPRFLHSLACVINYSISFFTSPRKVRFSSYSHSTYDLPTFSNFDLFRLR